MSARPDAGRLGLHQRRRDAVGLAGHAFFSMIRNSPQEVKL